MRGKQIFGELRAGALICTVAFSWFVACGGSAIVDGPGGGHAGSPASAGSSAAGAPAGAGASSVAGAPPGAGASSVAGASNAAGAGGANMADPACTAPAESGMCDGYQPSFWHNPQTGLCEPFIYGGCGGNKNRYGSRDDCMTACPNAGSNWGSCVNDTNCTLITSDCCGWCEPVENEQIIAINVANVPNYRNMHCASVGACAPCMQPSEDAQTGKYFKAVCRQQQCTAIDIRGTALTQCAKTSDCQLRDSADCCAQCDGVGWVPVNKNAELCGGAPAACDPCISKPPTEWDTVCLGGMCRLEGPL